ncbi:MAG: replication initiation factor domain-containing protein [Nitrospinae bacterium]|nr:replication initiation factor domain-containing protein [Nitrospinota bacterium]
MITEKKILFPSNTGEAPFKLSNPFTIFEPPECPAYLGGNSLLEVPSIDRNLNASNKDAEGVTITNKHEEIEPLEVFPLVIDKVSLVMDIKPEDRDGIKCYFIDIRKEDQENGELHTSFANRGSYDFAFNYRLGPLPIKGKGRKDASNLLIQIGRKASKRPFLRFEFNPNAVGISGVEKARKFLEAAFDYINMHGDYPDINNKIFVTRLDIAVDISGASIEDLLFYKPRIHKWKVYKDYMLDGKGFIQTQYLGSAKSDTKFCVYDKKAQLKKIKKDELLKELTRIECRFSKSTPLASILEIKNPFMKLRVLDARLVQAGNRHNEKYCFFIDSVYRRGVAGALKLIKDNKTRASYLKRLEDKASVDWWQPNKIFAGLPEALEKAGLSLFN